MKPLTLTGLKKKMNDGFSLDIPSFTFAENVSSVVGNNGAGKTTLLSLICGIRRKDYGEIYYDGIPLNEKNSEWWKLRMAAYLDESFMFDYYTVIEHFELVAGAWRITGDILKEKMETYAPYFNIESYMNTRIAALSYGNKKKAGMMATLIPDVEVIIWDEPFSGLDVKSQELMKRLIDETKDKRKIILSSNDIFNTAEISEETMILENGRLKDHIKGKPTYMHLKTQLTQ